MKASLFGVACITLLLAALAREAVLAPPPPARVAALGDAEQAAIYAAVITRLVTQDDTFGGRLHPTRLIIVRALLPDCPYDDREDRLQRWRSARRPARYDCRRRRVGTLAAPVEAALTTALARPGMTLTFVDDDRLPRDPVGGRLEGGGVLLMLHTIVMPEAGTLAVDGILYISNEAAAGNRYLFRRVDGHWVLVRSIPGWLS